MSIIINYCSNSIHLFFTYSGVSFRFFKSAECHLCIVDSVIHLGPASLKILSHTCDSKNGPSPQLVSLRISCLFTKKLRNFCRTWIHLVLFLSSLFPLSGFGYHHCRIFKMLLILKIVSRGGGRRSDLHLTGNFKST